MALSFNGTSSKGVYTGNLATGGEPYAIFAWVKFTSTTTDGMVAGFADLGGATFDECSIYAHGGTSKLRAYYKLAGANPQASSTTSMQTTWQPVLAVFDKNSRTIYYGSGAKVTDSTATAGITVANVDNFSVGVWPETGNSLFFGGEMAEVWIWRGTGTVPDDTDWASLSAGALPETIKTSGIVDGWTLQTQASSLTGYGGRTLTMTSTAQGGAHPITRVAGPALSSPTISGVTATGATPGITTDTASGTLYLVLNTVNTAPTAAQVKAGQNNTGAAAPSNSQAITTTGAKTATMSGLSASTTYYPFWVHTNGSSVDSSVTAGTSFTTSAAAATAVTMTGPSSGAVGVASTNFTIGANGTITGTVTVTPSDGGGGGTFTPTSVAISSGTPTATFTYTPASSGAKTISVTNNGGLTNPSNITYTASSVPGLVSSPLKTNAGVLHLSAPFEAFVLNATSGALVLRKTGLTSNAATGVVSFTDATLAAGTQYRVVWRRTDTGAQGVEMLTAA